MAVFKLTINGRAYQADVSPDTPLLWVLRDHLGLVVAQNMAVALQPAVHALSI